MNSLLRERFARLGPIQAIGRVSTGSPVVLRLTPAQELASLKTIDGTLALARRGLSLLDAKRTVETLVVHGQVDVVVPMVEDMAVLAANLSAAGIAAVAAAGPQVRLLRSRLGLTREGFASRFGMDAGQLERWEAGAAEPDATARSYLRAIAGNPDAVAEAYAAAP